MIAAEAEQEAATLAVEIADLEAQLEKIFATIGVDTGAQTAFLAEAERSPDVTAKKFGLSPGEVDFLLQMNIQLTRLRTEELLVRNRLQAAQRQISEIQHGSDEAGQVSARLALDPANHLTRSLRAIDFAGNVGLAVGAHGVVVRSEDGGETWALQTVGSSLHDLYDVAMIPEEGRGWAVGEQGLWQTEDGGLTWRLLEVPGLARPLRAIRFLTDDRFAAAGDDGTLVLSPDSGQTWQLYSPGAPVGVISDLLDPRGTDMLSEIVNAPGIINSLPRLQIGIDEGFDFVRLYLVGPPLVAAWQPQEGDAKWIVGRAGSARQAWQVTDRGEVVGHAELEAADLTAVAFREDGAEGWIATREGHILHTDDGGDSWRRLASSGDDFFTAMARRDGVPEPRDGLWRIAEGGALEQRPEVTGDAWGRDSDRRFHYPAPWFYVAIALSGFLFLRGVTRAPLDPDQDGSEIADQGLSDRPLEPGDPDPLGFAVIAKAISGFLRNENTEPPLTIAVTGDWGSGKSSILNLLRHDLRGYGYRPIWFNAWHHQSEESMLAALLESIRTQAIAPYWHPVGLAYRLNLLRIRFRSRPARLVILSALLVFSLGYLWEGPTEVFQSALRQATAGGQTWLEEVTTFARVILTEGAGQLGVLASAIGFMLNAQSRFGVSGRELRQLVGGAPARIKDLQSHLGFRHRFAQEFREVTEALKPLTMVIIIDDLDRCRADSAIDTLQLTNFLVSSGDCYILLGIAPEQLMTIIDKDLGPGIEAKSYLEKLINIEIPVPTLDEGDGVEVLEAGSPTPSEGGAKWRAAVKIALVVTLFGGILWTGQWIGSQVAEDHAAQVARATTSRVAPDAPAPPPDTRDNIGQSLEAQPPDSAAIVIEEEPPAPKVWVVPGDAGGRENWPAYLVAAVIVLLAGFLMWDRLRRTRLAVVRDTPNFSRALRIWFNVIQINNKTPRALKRYLNRLRYLAMRQRVSRTSDEVDWQQDISEPGLVALSALASAAPERLDDLVADPGAADLASVKAAYQKHLKTFKDWQGVQNDLSRYRALRGQITAR